MFLATTPEKNTTRDFLKIAGKENTVISKKVLEVPLS
jgi:hypothetical protein